MERPSPRGSPRHRRRRARLRARHRLGYGITSSWWAADAFGHGGRVGPALSAHVAALVQGQATMRAQFAYRRLQPWPPAGTP